MFKPTFDMAFLNEWLINTSIERDYLFAPRKDYRLSSGMLDEQQQIAIIHLTKDQEHASYNDEN